MAVPLALALVSDTGTKLRHKSRTPSKGCNMGEVHRVARMGKRQTCVRLWQVCDGVAQCDGAD